LIKLEQNYRSHGNILDAANALIKNNQTRLGKNLWTSGDQGDPVRALAAASDVDEAAFIVDVAKSLAADGLADERLLPVRVRAEPHDGRVELHELEVAQPGAGAQRHRHAVAGGHARVGGLAEHLAEPAGGEHDRAAVHGADAVVLALAEHVQGQAGDAAVRGTEEVDGQGVLDDLDLRRPLHRGDQGALDLRAGGVTAGVRDAVAVVAALAGQAEVAGGVVVEVRAELDELADRGRAVGDQDADGFLVARAGPGDQGVALVLVRGVLCGGAPVTGWHARPVFFVVASALVFGLTIERTGLVLSVFLTVLTAAGALPVWRRLEAFGLAAGLSIFSSLLFVTLLRLPIKLWP